MEKIIITKDWDENHTFHFCPICMERHGSHEEALGCCVEHVDEGLIGFTSLDNFSTRNYFNFSPNPLLALYSLNNIQDEPKMIKIQTTGKTIRINDLSMFKTDKAVILNVYSFDDFLIEIDFYFKSANWLRTLPSKKNLVYDNINIPNTTHLKYDGHVGQVLFGGHNNLVDVEGSCNTLTFSKSGNIISTKGTINSIVDTDGSWIHVEGSQQEIVSFSRISIIYVPSDFNKIVSSYGGKVIVSGENNVIISLGYGSEVVVYGDNNDITLMGTESKVVDRGKKNTIYHLEN